MAHSLTSAAPDLGPRIIIKLNQSKVIWHGNRDQLEAEGFIPSDLEWPTGKKHASFDTAANWFRLYWVNWQTPDAVHLYKVHQYSQTMDLRERLIQAQAIDLAKEINAFGKVAQERRELYYKSRWDREFQEFKRNLLGQKRRGRPAKSNSITQELQS